MTTESRHKELLTQFIDEVWNAGNAGHWQITDWLGVYAQLRQGLSQAQISGQR